MWKVRNGSTIYFWEDFWHEEGPLMSKFPKLYRISLYKHSSVRCFLGKCQVSVSSAFIWNRSFIERDKESLQQLDAILAGINLTIENDSLMWTHSSDKFTVKQFVQLYSTRPNIDVSQNRGWNTNWSTKLPPKIKMFL